MIRKLLLACLLTVGLAGPASAQTPDYSAPCVTSAINCYPNWPATTPLTGATGITISGSQGANVYKSGAAGSMNVWRTDTGLTGTNDVGALTFWAVNASGSYAAMGRILSQATGYTAGAETGGFQFQAPNGAGVMTTYLAIDKNGAFVSTPTLTQSVSFTFDGTTRNVSCDATSAACTGTLPACTNTLKGARFAIKKLDASGNAVSLARAGSDTIDGATSASTTTRYTVLAATCSDVAGRYDLGF